MLPRLHPASGLAPWLVASSFLGLCVFGCSASDDSSGGGEGGAPSGGSSSSSGGSAPASGGAPDASGGTASGGAPDASGGQPTGSGGGQTTDCTPNPAGAFTVDGDVVHDAKTCLDWQLGFIASPNGVDDGLTGTYADAALACDELTLGGFDDWRVPTHSELASIATECRDWSGTPPPWNAVFSNTGSDDLWTSTPVTGATDKYCLIQGSSGGGYGKPTSGYHVRCVRGAGTVTEVKDCNEADGCDSW